MAAIAALAQPAAEEAERRLAAGLSNADKQSKELRELALADCRAAAKAFHEIGNRAQEARALVCAGSVENRLGRLEAGIADARAGAVSAREAGERATEAEALTVLGGMLARIPELASARESLERAAFLWKSLDNKRGEVAARFNLCNLSGATEATVHCLAEIRPLVEKLGDGRISATLLINLAGSAYNVGDFASALSYGEDALAATKVLGDKRLVATAMISLAKAYLEIGEPQRAIEFSRDAMPLHQAVGDNRGLAATYDDLGREHLATGNLEAAIDYLQRCVQLREKIGNRPMLGEAWGELATVYSRAAQRANAEQAFRKGIDIGKAVADERLLGDLYLGFADHYLESGDLKNAQEYYRQASPLIEKSGRLPSQAGVFLGLGTTLMAEPDQARPLLQKSLDIYTKLGGSAGKRWTLYQLAVLDDATGNRTSALERLDEAIALSEPSWASLRSDEFRSGFFGTLAPLYNLKQDVLVRAGEPGAAFDVAERSRARSLVEGLDTSGLRQALPEPLRERMQSVNAALSGNLAKLIRLNGGRQAEADALERAIHDLQLQSVAIENEVRAANPGFAELTQPKPPPHEELQALLGEESVLIEYSLGDRASLAWLVTAHDIRAFRLPRKREIEALADGVHQAIRSGAPSAAAGQLSRVLLGPLVGKLGRRRLAIVADGVLQYLPFGVLSDPDKPSQMLLESHEIVMLPSASVLASLRRNSQARRAQKLLAVLADPVFEATDPRLPAGITPVSGGAEARGQFRLDRLPSSRREAETILSLAKSKGPSDQYLGFEATRDLLVSGAADRYRILHLATHGLFDPARPSTSGLVFSLFDRSGKPQEGFLFSHELYGLQLHTDLVVMSGCQTALGREIRGEGLSGMTRGLMYAGSPRIVASLWSVPDRSTADLMTLFYRAVLIEGATPAAALRKAQLALSRRPGMKPYHWAGFTYQGDWQWPSQLSEGFR